MPNLVIIAGPNGAGKTTFAGEYLSKDEIRFEFVNADEIARTLALETGIQNRSDIRAGRVMLSKIDSLVDAGADLAIETTLATLTYAHKIPVWRQRAYNVSLVYLRLNSVAESLDRVRRRVEAGGHDIPPEVIKRRFHKSTNYLETVYKPIVNQWYVWESREGTFAPVESFGTAMSEKLDAGKIDAALERAARKSVQGTREDRSGRFMAPKAFISYSHDSPEHKSWVRKLGSDLRAIGVDVVLDQWDLAPGQDVSLFMQKGISEADRVVLVCSSAYVSKSEKGDGGVGYERLIVTSEVVQSIDTRKFIPILRGSDPKKKLPVFLGPRMYIDFENDGDYDTKLIELARDIHGAPAISKPALGPNPFSGTPIASSVIGATSPSIPISREHSLNNTWFLQERERVQGLISKINLTAYMELRTNISQPLSKSQIELLNAVKLSEIRTFGWPIGITLENREEYRPQPYKDGIKAEVSIAEGDRISFDYWAAGSNGDFYLLQSLFEDSRKPNRIFFDTQVVRVTESLMFIESLYKKLGAAPEAKVGIQITHSGLKGRELTSASPNRHLFSRGATQENESTSTITTTLGKMSETRVDDVKRILERLFMLFNFMEFNTSVYDDIVRSFERGIIR